MDTYAQLMVMLHEAFGSLHAVELNNRHACTAGVMLH